MNFGSDRLSFDWHQERSYGDLSHADSSMYMLHDDMLMKLFNARRAGDSKVILDPDTKETRSAFLAFFFSKRAWAHELLDAVEETVGNIAHQLYEHGKAFYEIVLVQEFPGHCIYELDLIQWKNYKIKKGHFIQQIPKEVAEQYQVEQTYSIPLSKIVCFSWPMQLGGPKNWLAFKEKLRRFYDHDPTFGFIGSTLEGENTYDLQLHRRIHQEGLWKLTKQIHWVQRKEITNDEFFTEFYYLNRLLHFRRNQIILRDYILEELRQGFESIGTDGHGAQLGFELHPSIKEVDEAIDGWHKGEYDLDFIRSVLY